MPAAPLTPHAAMRWPLIKRAMRSIKPASTLEIGCGQGSMGARLAGLTRSFIAVEPDENSFRVARQRIEARGGTVINGLSDELPAGRSFDMVCGFEVLEHIEDDAVALRQWRSLIEPGGHLLVSVPAWQHMFGPSDTAVGHYRRYSPGELSELFRTSGFEPVRVSLYGWPLDFALEAVRNKLARGETNPGASVQDRTARSGRWLQPSNKIAELAVGIGVIPFRGLQRLAPGKGNGIVALARRA